MELLSALGRTLGFSFAAGVNLYATTAIIGLASRYHWVELPEQYRAFDSNWVIGIALALYVTEFVADKIPWVDSIWDAIHTVVRPLGGAVIAVTSMGPVSPEMRVIAGLAGAALAASSHLTKAGARVAANTSPEPFSNWILSLSEDGFVIGLALLAIKYPIAAAVVVLVSLAVILALASWLVRMLRRSLNRRQLLE